MGVGVPGMGVGLGFRPLFFVRGLGVGHLMPWASGLGMLAIGLNGQAMLGAGSYVGLVLIRFRMEQERRCCCGPCRCWNKLFC